MTTDEKLDLILQLIKRLERNQVPEVMTVPGCADFLQRSESTIRLWINKKSIPYHKRNGSIFFLKSELIIWIKRGRIMTNSEQLSRLILSD
jgi:predicted DNA-binding transcriptional regulator AlpA